MKIKKIIEQEKEAIICLNTNNRQAFLNSAIKNNLKWLNGEKVKKDDNCAFHIYFDGRDNISNLSTMCLNYSIYFKNLLRLNYR